jgi:hypothetical protein
MDHTTSKQKDFYLKNLPQTHVCIFSYIDMDTGPYAAVDLYSGCKLIN